MENCYKFDTCNQCEIRKLYIRKAILDIEKANEMLNYLNSYPCKDCNTIGISDCNDHKECNPNQPERLSEKTPTGDAIV